MSTRDLLQAAERDAIISRCQRFRYWLMRRWQSGPRLLFMMLNPSTADATVDDRTIRRCVGFAHAAGFGSIAVVNLFAFRATKPADLARTGWQIGPDADIYIRSALDGSQAVCVAWGAIGTGNAAEQRVQRVMPMILAAGHEPQCLRITRSGYPQHPLYLPGDCTLQPYSLGAIQEAMG